MSKTLHDKIMDKCIDLSEAKKEYTTEGVTYEIIAEESGKHYYQIFGLKLYATTSDEKHNRNYAQLIVNFANSLNNGEFKLEYAEHEKPKIHKGKCHMSKTNEVIPR